MSKMESLSAKLRRLSLRTCPLGDDYWDIVIEEEEEDEEMTNEVDTECYKILSVDVGLKNLGISVVIANLDYTFREIVYLENLDVTKFVHPDGIRKKSCHLPHSKSIADWLEHVFEYHQMFFDQCDFILVERQPPQGLVAVEQIIYSRYRKKTHLVSPSSMHKHFKIGYLDYEGRKRATENLCRGHIEDLDLVYEFETYARKHDIADSVCLCLFWLVGRQKEFQKQERRKRFAQTRYVMRDTDMSLNEWFDQFAYAPVAK